MSFRNRYPIYPRLVRRTKYSYETFNIIDTNVIPAHTYSPTAGVAIVNQANELGMRKAKNFNISLVNIWNIPLQYALVYVHQGTIPSQLNTGTIDNAASIYEPNQNVILSGLALPGVLVNKSTRLARNLSSGDQIYLVSRPIYQSGDEAIQGGIYATINYSITF